MDEECFGITVKSGIIEAPLPAIKLMVSASTLGKVATNTSAGSILLRTRRDSGATHGRATEASMKVTGKAIRRLDLADICTPTRASTSATTIKTSQMASVSIAGPTATSTRASGKMVFAAASENLNSRSRTHSLSVNSSTISLKVGDTSSILMAQPIGVSSRLIKDMVLAGAPGPMVASTLVSGRMERKTAWGACLLKMARPSLTAGEAVSERLKKP